VSNLFRVIDKATSHDMYSLSGLGEVILFRSHLHDMLTNQVPQFEVHFTGQESEQTCCLWKAERKRRRTG